MFISSAYSLIYNFIPHRNSNKVFDQLRDAIVSSGEEDEDGISGDSDILKSKRPRVVEQEQEQDQEVGSRGNSQISKAVRFVS